jgi:lipopolysaccharide export system permease protein
MRAGISLTLSSYIARRYAAWFIAVAVFVASIVFIAETVELLRRAASIDVPLGVLLQMAVFKVPSTLQDTFPFIVLASGIGTFWHLARYSETVIARASGVSAWRLLLPAALVVVVVAAVRVVVFDPVAAVTAVRDQQLEETYFDRRITLVATTAHGLWLRVREGDGAGERIVHAGEVQPDQLTLRDVMILDFDEKTRFAGRIDAGSARIATGSWSLADVREVRPNQPVSYKDSYDLPTGISVERIINSLSEARTLSVFRLPEYIALLEQTGFSARPHEVRLHQLLSTPVLFLGMFLLGAAFSLRPHRFGGTAIMVGVSVASGFVFYFLASVIYNLGTTGIPPEAAAWTPSVAIALIGATVLLHMEEG